MSHFWWRKAGPFKKKKGVTFSLSGFNKRTGGGGAGSMRVIRWSARKVRERRETLVTLPLKRSGAGTPSPPARLPRLPRWALAAPPCAFRDCPAGHSPRLRALTATAPLGTRRAFVRYPLSALGSCTKQPPVAGRIGSTDTRAPNLAPWLTTTMVGRGEDSAGSVVLHYISRGLTYIPPYNPVSDMYYAGDDRCPDWRQLECLCSPSG